MDILDLLNGSPTHTYKGKYFAILPSTFTVFDSGSGSVDDFKNRAIPFRYEFADTQTKQHLYPLQNLANSANVDAVIKTKQGKLFTVDGVCQLSDGYYYQILTITKDMSSASKWAAECLPNPVGSEYTIRMTKIDNPWANLPQNKEANEGTKTIYTIGT